MKRTSLISLIGVFVFLGALSVAGAQDAPYRRTHFIYFTGIGCPHCAKIDPVLLEKTVRQRNILVVEYEIYKQRENSALLMIYNDLFDSGLGVPLLIAGQGSESSIKGDVPIIKKLDEFIVQYAGNGVLLENKTVPFEDLYVPDLKGLPKIWYRDRVAVKVDRFSQANQDIKNFILKNITPAGLKPIKDKAVDVSGSSITFNEASEKDGWIYYYQR